MKLHPIITTHDMVTILRDALEKKLGLTVEEITITSHSKAINIIFDYDTDNSTAIVECDEFRHRTMP